MCDLISQNQRPAILTGLPSRGNWWGVVFLVAFGGLFLLFPIVARPSAEEIANARHTMPSETATWIAMSLLASPFFLGALAVARWIRHGFIRADEEGLSWRGSFGVKRAAWHEVSDYYLMKVPKSGIHACIVTPVGKLNIKDVSHAEELREIVAERATAGKARRWQHFGLRREDNWPRTFGYSSGEVRFMPWLVFSGFLYGPILMLSKSGPQGLIDTARMFWTHNGPGLSILFILTTLAMFAIMPAMLVPIHCVLLRLVRERRDDKIEVSPDGITFRSPTRHLAVRWDEVINYYKVPVGKLESMALYVVETRQGNFDFVHTIANIGAKTSVFSREGAALRTGLTRIISEYATGAAASKWQTRAEQRKTTVLNPDGSRFYSYRTNMVRALLWFPSFFAFMPLITYRISRWTYDSGIKEETPRSDGVWWTGFFLLIVGYLWWRYYKGGIRTDEYGITQMTALGPRTVAWHEVAEYGRGGEDILQVFRVKGRMSWERGGQKYNRISGNIWFYPIFDDVDELIAEIARCSAPTARRVGQIIDNEL
ncbi:MAG TPA: hypothetical protein VF719_05955 [Abditibacteriaceae bacterium]